MPNSRGPLHALEIFGNGRLWRNLKKVALSEELTFFSAPPLDDFPPTEFLYHYTDIRGLMGIIESNSLRASAAYYLNDSSEIEYGRNRVIEALQKWVAVNQTNPAFSARVLLALFKTFTHPGTILDLSSNIYVTCFCESDNLLSQWRAYSQKGGYSLGFEKRLLASDLRAAGPYGLRLSRVIYDVGTQLVRLGTLISNALKTIDAETLGVERIPDERGVLITTAMFLRELLLDEIVRYKHPAFREEREWRLIARFDFRYIPDQNQPQTPGNDVFKFRNADGYVVPYINLLPQKGKLPLASIRFGPSLNYGRYENPTTLFLVSNGFSGVKLSGSELPVIL